MRDAGLATLAFLVLAGFLGILAYKVPSPDLIVVLGVTLALAGFDFFFHRHPH